MRNLARLLFIVAGLLLVGCSAMTGAFGWSQGNNLVASIITATVFVAADIGGAAFVTLSGTSAANQEAKAARWFAFAAILCMGMTLAGILGFQSENREARAGAREKSLQLVDAFVGWAKDLATTKEQAKGKGKVLPESLDSSIEAVGKQVTAQLEMLGKGKIAPVADGQATTLARVSGMSEAQARSWTVTLTSFALLVIQYVAWWGYGFCRQKLEPKISGIVHGPMWEVEEENDGDNVEDNVPRISKKDARKDVCQLIENGIELSNGEYARRWGQSDSRASKWLGDFADAGLMKQVWRGRRKVAVAPKPGGKNGTGRESAVH